MNDMRNPILLFLALFSISTSGQDLLSRQAPVGRKMKAIDSVVLEKTIKDKENYEKVYKIGSSIIVDDKKGWEWISNEDYTYHDDSYPYEISYRKYVNHPQYTVVGQHIYNKAHALVRVEEVSFEIVSAELLRYVYIRDYRNNKYNFRKEDAKAQNYVKKQLGITNNASPSYTYSEPAMRYLEQLEKDHQHDFDNLLKCERIGNLSFKLTYGNSLGEPVNTYKVTYLSKGVYRYDINITDLPLEQIDFKKYESMISPENEKSKTETSDVKHLHKVKRGETIPSIARLYNTTVESLCKLNGMKKSAHLSPGQIIKIDGAISPEAEVVDTIKLLNTSEVDESPSFPDSDDSETQVEDVENRVFDVVEEMPQFPGGPSALFEYLSKSIRYPIEAEKNGVQGRVICCFVVGPDGLISDVKVVKSVDPSLDNEAKRVIGSMPKWIPGKKNGIPVSVKYTTPVTFRLQ